MNSIKPIYWHQGLFLKPHHFQYLQAFAQEDSLAIKESIKPYFWGLSKIDIDKKELLNKNFLLENLELVFIDGTSIKLDQNTIATARSFEDVEEDSIKVYVGLKSFSSNDVNVTELDSYENIQKVDTRFISKKDALNVNNLYHSDETAEIQFMDYYIKIFFENELDSLNSYQVIPIAKIDILADKVTLSSDYTPPLINIEADINFYEIIKYIEKDLTSHAIQLEEYKLPSDSSTQEPQYLKYIMALQAIVPYISQLKHLIKTPNIHPWQYYGLFSQLIGVLSTFSSRVNFLGRLENGNYLLQEYNHLNLNECFSNIKLLISELLDGIIIGPDYVLPFKKDDTSFSLDCPVLIFNARYRYFLVLKMPLDSLELQSSFSEFAKISSSLEIEMIVDRSLKGLPFELHHEPIQGLPQRENSCYFELKTDDSHWSGIQQAQNISIEFDDAVEDLYIELVVLKR
ncbi:MAG: type VI secretion system baseplate subunit TssK [Sulfurimonas sp.]|nr:type VI secretion system baseplate subunit TssK [Sulfurimonas sp.]